MAIMDVELSYVGVLIASRETPAPLYKSPVTALREVLRYREAA